MDHILTTQMEDWLLLCDNIVLIIILDIILLKPTDHWELNYSQIKLGLLTCCKEDHVTRQTIKLAKMGQNLYTKEFLDPHESVRSYYLL